MSGRVQVRRGVNGVGWVVINAMGDMVWRSTWKEAIDVADWWAQRTDRQRWTGGA